MSADLEATRTHASRQPNAGPARSELPIADPARFVIHHEHARGGLGRVLAAHDRVLARPVAIKELLAPAPDTRARFVREVRLTARLQHPAIVPIYEAGRWRDGEPFYAMKLVAGRSLKEAIATAASLDERLALLPHLITVTDAVAYAHSERIIHRDLKPANVLLGEFGETIVIDWGIAKELDDDDDPRAPSEIAADPDATIAGAVLGTPQYMPPEQARGAPTDERADVYALGAMLYHLLTGRPPYAASAPGVPAAVLAGAPQPIHALEPAVRPDLVDIASRAMAREPSDRYTSARALAEDLRRFQTGQLVASHHYSWRSLVVRWLRAHRLPVALSAAFALALAVVGVFSIVRITRAREAAEDRRNHVVLLQARAELDRDPAAALAWLKSYPIASGDLGGARTIFESARGRGAIAVFPDLLHGMIGTTETGHLLTIVDENQVVDFDPRTGTVTTQGIVLPPDLVSGDFSMRGDRLAILARREVVIYDLAHHGRREIPFPDGVTAKYDWFEFTDHDRVIGFGAAGGLGLVHVDTGTVEYLRGDPAGAAIAFAVAPDAATLAWIEWPAHDVHVVAGAHTEDRSIGLPMPAIVTFTGDGRLVAAAENGHLYVWPRTGGAARDIAVCSTTINRIRALAHNELATHCQGGATSVIGLDDGRVDQLGSNSTLHGWLEASADGNLIFGIGEHATTIWNRAAGTSADIAYNDDAAYGRVTPDGAFFVTTSWVSSTARVFRTPVLDDRVAAPGGTRVMYSPAGRIESRGDGISLCNAGACRVLPIAASTWAASSPDGRRLGFGTATRIGWIDLETGVEQFASTGLSPNVEHVASAELRIAAWSPTGELAVATDHRSLVLVDPGGAARTIEEGAFVLFLAFSSDGHWLAWADEAGNIALDELATGHIRQFASRWHPTLAFPTGGPPRLVIGAGNKLLTWDVTRDKPDLVHEWRDRVDTAVAVSRDGDTIFTTGTDQLVRISDVAHGTSTVLATHVPTFAMLAISPDNRYLAGGVADGTVWLWELASGDVHVLRGHQHAIVDLAFAPDGDHLATVSDEHIVTWDLRRLPVPLTDPEAVRAAIDAESTVVLEADDHPVTPLH